MQTVHQWSRGRSKCIALQNPPLLHNLQAEASSDGSGLTAGFQAMYAGIPAQTVFDIRAAKVGRAASPATPKLRHRWT